MNGKWHFKSFNVCDQNRWWIICIKKIFHTPVSSPSAGKIHTYKLVLFDSETFHRKTICCTCKWQIEAFYEIVFLHQTHTYTHVHVSIRAHTKCHCVWLCTKNDSINGNKIWKMTCLSLPIEWLLLIDFHAKYFYLWIVFAARFCHPYFQYSLTSFPPHSNFLHR